MAAGGDNIRPLRKRLLRRGIRLLAVGAVLALLLLGVLYWRMRQVREALYAALSPVQITNCMLERFGSANDGGYLLCGNLLAAAQSAYSYGLAGDDAWGCAVTARTAIPVHQYDCFDTRTPSCAGDSTIFHAECVGHTAAMIDGRPFDSMANHITANGDTGKRLIVKMDVEGSEWRSLAAAPDHVLDAIDQLAVEFHGVDRPHFLETAARLNQFFNVAHVHQNNYECRPGFDPFPGPVFEVLFVNKRMGIADASVRGMRLSPLDAPNSPARPDCQQSPGGSEMQRIIRWLRRAATTAINYIRAGAEP